MKKNVKTNLALFLISLTSFNQKLKADDSIGKLYNFTEDVRTVVLKSPGGNPMPDKEFYLSTTGADQMKALASLDNSTRNYLESKNNKDCDQNKIQTDSDLEEKIKKRDFEIYVSATVTDTKFEQNTIGRFMSDEYINYIGKLSLNGNAKANDVYSLSALENKYQILNPGVDLSKMSFKDKEAALSNFANSYLGVKLPDGLVMKEMAFNQMVSNSKSWKETLDIAKDKLSNEQKIQLVSKVGGYFGNRYNYTRFNEGDSAKGYVSIEQLFDSVKSGIEGGICRDIALAQTQMLRELGFKNNYVVTYKTINGYHSDVITTDPSTGKVVKFNYAETTEMKKGSGSEALIQDSTMPDHGLSYRIHDADGKPVTQVPSELGSMLKEATGGEVRSFTDKNYSLYKAGVKFGTLDGNLFTGKTSSGENIYGMAVFKNYESEYLSLNGGMAISKLEGNRTYMKIDQENLYARLGAEVRTPSLEIGAVSIGGFAGGSGEVLGYKGSETDLISNRSRNTDKLQLDAKAEGYVGIKSSLNLGNTSLTNKTYINYYPDLANVADAGRVTAARDSIMIESGISHSLNDQQAIILDSTVMIKNYGTSMGIKAAYEDYEDRFRVKAGYETPMSKDVPSFLPGGTSHAYVGVDKETKSGLVFSMEYDRDLTSKNNTFFLKASKRF